MALRNFCFDITELDKVSTNALIPRFDLAVDDLPIISPRPEVERSGSFRGVQFWPRWKCPCRKVDQGNNGSRSCAMRYVNRDIFWLFWSRAARKSPWIDWEWRTALATKSIAGIQPHPLEPSQGPIRTSVRYLYEGSIVHSRQSWLRNVWRRASIMVYQNR